MLFTCAWGKDGRLPPMPCERINFEAWSTVNYRVKLLDQLDILKTMEIALMKSIHKMVDR